ncbi:MAG: dienelactone hydrolase family protein [Alphaproteobacteria bacterium]|nr:dienelactone hydrolase family protein [Alphaproteobacteria bacterium]
MPIALSLLIACAPEDVSDAPPADPTFEEPSVPAEPEAPVEPTASRCTVEPGLIRCEHEITTIMTGFTGLVPRDVHFQVPLGSPPPGGWPTVVMFQGSFVGPDTFWEIRDDAIFGMWNQGLLIKELLDRGFAIVAPEAHLGGTTAWDTNLPPMAFAWDLSTDHRFMLDLFAALDAGELGPLDSHAMYATGISSGGYMTSRVGLEYPERFRALAIHSGSWATCSTLCVVPALSPDHLPTLFLQGEDDPLVPLDTVLDYVDALDDASVEHRLIVEPGAGHEWIAPAPTEIPDWFEAH